MGDYFNCDIRPLALVVEDDPLIRMDLTDMLEGMGFDPAEAQDVSSALAYLQGNGERVSFLLTDVQMSGSRNGTTLANHVNHVWPHIRILVTSGVIQPSADELPDTAQFIRKPLTEHALQAYVARFPADMLPQQAG